MGLALDHAGASTTTNQDTGPPSTTTQAPPLTDESEVENMTLRPQEPTLPLPNESEMEQSQGYSLTLEAVLLERAAIQTGVILLSFDKTLREIGCLNVATPKAD